MDKEKDAQTIIRMEVPFFQTPNNIFDLDINVRAPKVKKVKGNRKSEIVTRPMKPHEKLVYIYFCRCGNNGGQAFPSYNTIAKKCSISRVSAIDAVEVLKNNKFIIKKNRKKSNVEQNTNEYLILPPSTPDILEGSTPSISPSMPGLLEGSTPSILPSTPGVPKKEPYNNNNIKKEPYKNIYSSIVNYLNEKVGANYRSTTKKTQDLINARLNEGFTVENFYDVIDKKVKEWTGQISRDGIPMENYLRPETLFGNKFESYVNQKVSNNINTSKKVDNFNNYDQRDYDFDELEKKLLGWQEE